MKVLKSTGIIFLLVTGSFSYGQQIPLLSNYYVNPYLSNPASAGQKGNTVFLLNRSPWNGEQTNPETFLGTVDGLMQNGTAGYGAMVYNDKVNVLGKTGAYGTYNYKMALPANSILSMGFSLGIEQNRILFDRIKEEKPRELSLANNAIQTTNFDANIGLLYQLNGLSIGVASYQLFNNNTVVVKEEFANKYNYRFIRHLVGTASYRIVAIPETFFIDPVLQIRAAKNTESQSSISLMTNYKNKIWAGAGYRQSYGVDILGGILLGNKLTIGYSYGMPGGDIKKNSTTAHEFIIGLKLINTT